MPTVDGSSREPLDGPAVRRALIQGSFFPDVRCVEHTGSTNADLGALARTGAVEGTVIATDLQTTGRGRLARTWISPPRAGLAVSVLLRPTNVPRPLWTWLPLLAGVVVARTVGRAGVGGKLKWPNDVLVDDRKIAGILVEVVGGGTPDAVVVGIGLNVTNRARELPDGATSLDLEGAPAIDRNLLLADLLDELARTYQGWRDAGGDLTALRAEYVALCATIGRAVRVDLPDGSEAIGTATGIDEAGRLVIDSEGREVRLGAGDVVHVR